MWNCINALSSAADGSDGLHEKAAAPDGNSPKAQPEQAPTGNASCPLPPLPSLSSMQSSVRQVTRSQSQNDSGSHGDPFRPGSVPLSTQMQSAASHFPPKAPASFRPPRALRPLQTPHAYANHFNPFNPSSPMAAFSHSSGTPAAMSSTFPFSPSPHVSGGVAPPQSGSPAFCSAPLPGTAIAEPPMAAFLQSAADAARRFRISNSLTPRHSTLRPRSASPTKLDSLAPAPTAFPEIFSPRTSRSSSAKLPVSAAAQGPMPDIDGTIRAAQTAQEELSAELDRADAMAAAFAAAPPVAAAAAVSGEDEEDAELEAHMAASASAIEAASRELEERDPDAAFGRTLRKAASAQDEMSRELDLKVASRAWTATVAAAASAQDDVSHDLELRSSTAAAGGTSGSIGDAFGELERQVCCHAFMREVLLRDRCVCLRMGAVARGGVFIFSTTDSAYHRHVCIAVVAVFCSPGAVRAAMCLSEGGSGISSALANARMT